MKETNSSIVDFFYEQIKKKKYYKLSGKINPVYVEVKDKTKADMNLFINKTNLTISSVDGTQVNLNKELVNNEDIKRSENGFYGVSKILSILDVFNKICLSYEPIKTKSINSKGICESKGCKYIFVIPFNILSCDIYLVIHFF